MQNTKENNNSEAFPNYTKRKKIIYGIVIFFAMGSQAALFQNCGQMEVKKALIGSHDGPQDPVDCELPWGGFLANGQSTQAYQSATVPSGQTCQVQTRICSNGTLSGSYTFRSCQAQQPPAGCALPWGGTIASGQSVTAYQAGTVPSGQTCASQSRSCSNGTLSGSYAFQNCQVQAAPSSCSLPWGGTIASGQSVTAYQAGSVPNGQTCTSQSRSCNNGTLSGSYTFQSCQAQQPPAACTLPWGGTIASGQSVTAYQTGSVPSGQTCSSQSRSCTNGALSGSYTFQTCQVQSAPNPDPQATAQLTVHNYSSGNGPANLVSNGIPFKPNALNDVSNFRILDGSTEVPVATKILARWPNNSIRVVLVQFESSGTGTRNYTLSIGSPRTTAARALVAVNFRFPRRIATLPADYLSESLIMWEQKPVGESGFSAWENKQRNNFSAINREPSSGTSCSRDDHYYDAANSSYNFYARSGDVNHLVNGRRWAYHHGRDQVHLTGANTGFPRCPGNYLTNTRYTFVDSLVRDYFFWGDEESLRVGKLVVDNFYVPHEARWYYQAPGTRRFWTEREAAFAQLGLIALYEASGSQTYLNLAKDRFHSLYRIQTENNNGAWVHNLYDHDPEEGCRTNEYGSSSFMSGLLAESLIRYHKLTKDPVARQSILYAADYLRANNVSGDGNGFVYLGCDAYSDAEPDIDLLIVHLYGYAYKLSNFTNQNYLNLGQRAFNYSTANGYAGGHKQYNQHFRSSGHFPAYIDPSVASY